MASPTDISRRRFLGKTASLGTAAVAAPYFVPSHVLAAPGRKGANDKINVGVIGTGTLARSRHFPKLLEQPDVVITAVCDVQKDRLAEAVERCQGTAKPYTDYRELLQQGDVDAVAIVTPPHWHALMAIDAAEAGKDFYLEKPMTLSVAESLAVVRAALKHRCVPQVGTQIHASQNYRRVVEYVRSGNLGKINVARAFCVMNQGPEGIGYPPQTDPPANIDWEMWIGPSPMIKYNPLIVEKAYPNCSFMAHSGGWTPGMAPHLIDLPYWALELGFPKRTSASGGRYLVRDIGDAPDTQEVLWEYENFTMAWTMSLVNSFGFDFQGANKIKRRTGVYFQGVNGTLMADYGTLRITPEGDRLKDAKVPAQTIPASKGHYREWLDAIRTREQPLCHVGYHYKMDVAIALANLSMKLGRTLQFDPKTETIAGDEEATRLSKPTYRDPWKLPEQYL